jgi:hypothetical protein
MQITVPRLDSICATSGIRYRPVDGGRIGPHVVLVMQADGHGYRLQIPGLWRLVEGQYGRIPLRGPVDEVPGLSLIQTP